MSKSPAIRLTLPPVQVVFEPSYLSQPVVQQVYARLLPPVPGLQPPARPPVSDPAPLPVVEVPHDR
jgi:hypothetical protein